MEDYFLICLLVVFFVFFRFVLNKLLKVKQKKSLNFWFALLLHAALNLQSQLIVVLASPASFFCGVF